MSDSPPLAEMYGHLLARRFVEDVAMLIGESPEAWRGVFTAMATVRATFGTFDPLPADIEAKVTEAFGASNVTDEDRGASWSTFVYDAPALLAAYAKQWLPDETCEAVADAFTESSIELLDELGIRVVRGDDA